MRRNAPLIGLVGLAASALLAAGGITIAQPDIPDPTIGNVVMVEMAESESIWYYTNTFTVGQVTPTVDDETRWQVIAGTVVGKTAETITVALVLWDSDNSDATRAKYTATFPIADIESMVIIGTIPETIRVSP